MEDEINKFKSEIEIIKNHLAENALKESSNELVYTFLIQQLFIMLTQKATLEQKLYFKSKLVDALTNILIKISEDNSKILTNVTPKNKEKIKTNIISLFTEIIEDI